MTEVAGGQNEANKTFAPEFFVNLTLFVNHFSCGYETYRICIIEDGEHFGEAGLRLTPHLGREIRQTIIILRIFAASNTTNSRLHIHPPRRRAHLLVLVASFFCWRRPR